MIFRNPSRFLLILFTVLICGIPFFVGSSLCADEEAVTNPDENIDISADLSKIKWDKNIIRSWDAKGNVVAIYSKEGKKLSCKASNALFTREGDERPFKDKLILTGNVLGDLNGMEFNTGELTLFSDGESFRVESGKNTTVHDNNCSVFTNQFIFDASDGIGHLPEGANFDFIFENGISPDKKAKAVESNTNVFSQCMRIDINGGLISTTVAELHYKEGNNNEFSVESMQFPEGARLYSMSNSDSTSFLLTLGEASFDFAKTRLEASKKISIENKPCKITAESLVIDWTERSLVLDGDVVLNREMVEFTTGKIELNWNDAGLITFNATQKPKMTIVVPEETAGDILKGN